MGKKLTTKEKEFFFGNRLNIKSNDFDEILKEIKVPEDQITIETVTDPKKLDEFYDDWSVTFIGVEPSKEEASFYFGWAETFAPVPNKKVYLVTGKLMNDYYGLTDWNAYPEDLHIFVFKNEDFTNDRTSAMIRGLSMRAFGGRWFYDIVENNKRKQAEIDE